MKIEIEIPDDDKCGQAALIWSRMITSTISDIDQTARRCLKHDLDPIQALNSIRELAADVLCKIEE